MSRRPARRLIDHRRFVAAIAGVVAALAILTVPAAGAAGHRSVRVQAARVVRPPHLFVTGASLIEARTGQLLYGLHANAERPIASATKLMTALVTLQHVHRLRTVFAQNGWRAAPGDSQIGLVPGERMSVHDLLLAMMLPSADDAAEDLAYNVGHHSVGRFISMMNAEARALHLTRTHYSTPVGLDTPRNFSSPTDLDRLAAYARAHWPFFRWVVNRTSAELHTGRYRRVVVNLNDLVRRIPWVNGVKTGHTGAAGYVLVASGTRHGMTLIASVLGTSSQAARDQNALALLDYGFGHFHPVEPLRAGQVVAHPAVQYSGQRATVVAAHSVHLVIGNTQRVHLTLHLPRQLTGPLPRHAVVGQAIVVVGKHRVARVPLLLDRALPAVSPVTKATHFLIRPSTLLWLILAASAVLAYSGTRRRRHRPTARGHVEEG